MAGNQPIANRYAYSVGHIYAGCTCLLNCLIVTFGDREKDCYICEWL